MLAKEDVDTDGDDPAANPKRNAMEVTWKRLVESEKEKFSVAMQKELGTWKKFNAVRR